MSLEWGIVADDNSGATDAAGMLTARGVRTALVLDAACLASAPSAFAAFDAVVVGTQNRAVPPAAAAAATRAALRALRAAGATRFQLKYCSTFDSTPEGNIGPTLDAALDELQVPATIVCPALPVNRRTVYQGHLFVGRQLLSESPLRNHPLNPMTDANLLRWLGRQTRRRIELMDLETVRRGPEAVRSRLDELIAAGVAYIVTDATEDADLIVLARATAEMPLLSGGSGITAALPSIRHPDRIPLDFRGELATLPRATLVISGSQSPDARRQAEHAWGHGFLRVVVDVAAILEGRWDGRTVEDAIRRRLADGGAALVAAPMEGAGSVDQTQALARRLNMDEVACGRRIASALAALGVGPVRDGLVGRLVVAGGETSGAVCAALGIRAAEIGLPLSPGVPYGFPLPDRRPLIVLKSGNFGSEDLYVRVRAL